MPLRVSVLGRSVGEAVVIRFGQDLQRCVLLDSFMSRGRPASLRYLAREGLDSSQVLIVAVSHWHNDHSSGVAELLRAAPEARFVHPYVMDPEHLVELSTAARVAAETDGQTHGLEAFGEALAALKARGDYSEAARSKQTLWQDAEVHIRALSPTSSAVDRGLVSVADSLRSLPGKGKSAKAVKPNLTSMVLWVETETHRVLLGADLEAHARFGWRAAIADAETLQLGGLAQLVKVAHHGSENADEDEMWERLLQQEPDAVVTPYAPAKRPRQRDLSRLLARPCRLQIAAGPHWTGWSAALAVNTQFMLGQAYSRQRLIGVARYDALAGGGWELTTFTL